MKIEYQTSDLVAVFESIVLESIGFPAESIENGVKSDKSSAYSV